MFSTCKRLHPCGIGDKSSMTQAHINLAGLHAGIGWISAHNNTACIPTTMYIVTAQQPDHPWASVTATLLYWLGIHCLLVDR